MRIKMLMKNCKIFAVYRIIENSPNRQSSIFQDYTFTIDIIVSHISPIVNFHSAIPVYHVHLPSFKLNNIYI